MKLGSRWVHKKTGGLYQVIGVGFLQHMDEKLDSEMCIMYITVAPGSIPHNHIFIRPLIDFTDGRFEHVDDG